MRQLAAILLASLAALPSLAEEKQKPTFFSETIEVRVVDVDVVVTDKSGKPVTGLAKDDFELYENGKKQPITNFLEVRGNDAMVTATTSGPAQPVPAQQADNRARNIVIFVDSATMHPFVRNRVFTPMETFLRRSMRAGDHVMIVSWNPGLKVELPFTNNVTLASTTLNRIMSSTTNALAAERDLKIAEKQIDDVPNDNKVRHTRGGDEIPPPPISDGVLIATTLAEKLSFEHAQRVEALKSVIASMRGLGGRNALVVLTDQISTSPALPIFQYLDQVKNRFDGGQAYNPYAEAKRYEVPDLPKQLGDLANSSGVTLYPISPAGLGIEMSSIAADRLASEYVNPSRPMLHADEGLLTLQQIAAATGGAALTGSNNFDLAFDTLTSDLTTYYSLGYRPEGEQKDVVRDIAVKLRKKGYNVRARRSYVEKSLKSEMSDAVAANLLYPIARNDLNISLAAGGAAVPSSDQKVVPVLVKIPTASLTLVPDGSDLVGQFSTYTAFMRGDGKVSEVKTQQHQFRFPADSLKKRKEITVKYDLTIDAKTEDVSLGIMDDTSHATGFAVMKLNGA
jgi:VWFA-related protein